MKKIDKMSRTKLKLSDLNPHLMCVLCGGYYIDATTIVECLHSFCRSCIVKHLESSKYCPICEVQVHKTKPLVNIRPDKTLQDIVYKLVPGLYANEMRNRRKFYMERPHYMKPNDSELVGEVSEERKIYFNDENITLSLDYHKSNKHLSNDNSFQEVSTPVKSEKRYFKCPTAVTIYHLQKLLKAKYDLNDNNYKVEIYYKDQPLHEDYSLLDLSYIYLWKSVSILEWNQPVMSPGEMTCVYDFQKGTLDLTFKIFESVVKRQRIEVKPKDEEEGEVEAPGEVAATEESAKLKPEAEVNAEEEVKAGEEKSPGVDKEKVTSTEEPVKENGIAGEESKEVQLQISESGVMSVSQVENGDIVRTVEESAPKIIDNFRNKTNTGIVPVKVPKPSPDSDHDRLNRLIPEQSKQAPKSPVKPYKTIRCSPKSWNPVIPKEKLRPTLMKNSDEPKKPLKFFKMRNMPRFLGNPASGVKPLYAESSEKEGSERKSDERKDNAKALKNILKIDPKTLRPIEKEEMPIISAPSTPNLLTNPFIPNNNHFLFSDPLLLHPNAGNYSNKSEKHNNNNNNNNNNINNNNNNNNNNSSSNSNFSNSRSGSNNSNNTSNGKASGSSRQTIQNGTFPPICFPSPDYCSSFFHYQPNFPKPSSFYPPNEKVDPLMRASRLSPFGSLPGFNMAGFHASLPPSISLLLKQQPSSYHFKKSIPDKKCFKDESTKDTSKSCDDNSLKVEESGEKKNEQGCKEVVGEKEKEKQKEKEKEKEKEKDKEKEKEKDEKDKERERDREKEREKGKEKERERKKMKKEEEGERKEEKEKKEKKKEEEEKAVAQPEQAPLPLPPLPVKEDGKKEGKVEDKKKDEKEEGSKEKCVEVSTCLDDTSACNEEAKPETVENIDNKSVNDKNDKER